MWSQMTVVPDCYTLIWLVTLTRKPLNKGNVHQKKKKIKSHWPVSLYHFEWRPFLSTIPQTTSSSLFLYLSVWNTLCNSARQERGYSKELDLISSATTAHSVLLLMWLAQSMSRRLWNLSAQGALTAKSLCKIIARIHVNLISFLSKWK